MAKKKKTRTGVNRKNFVAIPFSKSLPLGTLADETVIKTSLLNAFGEDIFIMSIDCTFALREFSVNEAPLFFGYAHGDLTVAEILEAINAEVTDPDDIIANEFARRPVRKVGGFVGDEVEPIYNDGKKVRQRIKFSVGDGHTIDVWVKNQSGAILTTGAILELDGVIFGRWQR